MSSNATMVMSKSAHRQVRRAWFIIATSTAIFSALAIAAISTAFYVYQHATTGQSALLEVVSGSGVLWRSSDEEEWRWVTSPVELDEGDQVSTTLGAIAQVTMFDGSVLEVAEDSIVELERMRSSRFTDSTKLIRVRPRSGTAYITMAPHGSYEYAEFIAASGDSKVVMADGQDVDEAGTFLLELIPTGSPGAATLDRTSIRVAVLDGVARISNERNNLTLSRNEQVIFSPEGQPAEVTPATRQFIRNGSFQFGLAGWSIVEDPSDGDGQGSQATVVPYSEVNAIDEAIELTPAGAGTLIGIEQEVGQTLRVNSELTFSFEVKLIGQSSPDEDDSNGALPLTVELRYLDDRGSEHVLARSFYSDAGPQPEASNVVASPLSDGVWELVVFDLNNLKPLPVQISSIVLYASGGDFRTQVANISLTSSELTGKY